jgi:taurine dioxygenase
MSTANAESRQGLKVRPLGLALGAEVTGLDLARPLDDETFGAVHAAWMRHLVLVFPGQAIDDAQQIAFSRRFGPLEVHHQKIIRSAAAPEIFRVSNVDEEGRLMPRQHPTVAQLMVTLMWHTDSSFRAVPSMGSILHGHEVTAKGGETCFTNMYKVWAALPERLKAEVRGRKARHDFGYLAKLAAIKPLDEAERRAMPPVWQPLVRRHPVTGNESLYISPIYNDAVEDMADEDAVALVKELTEFAGRPEFVYRHRWRQHDILMWDNRCTMHRIEPYDPDERRVLHRTTVAGDGPVMAA